MTLGIVGCYRDDMEFLTREWVVYGLISMSRVGMYWGVSYEEYIPADLADGVFKRGTTRNGFALLGSSGPPVLEYYKRHLVPGT